MFFFRRFFKEVKAKKLSHFKWEDPQIRRNRKLNIWWVSFGLWTHAGLDLGTIRSLLNQQVFNLLLHFIYRCAKTTLVFRGKFSSSTCKYESNAVTYNGGISRVSVNVVKNCHIWVPISVTFVHFACIWEDLVSGESPILWCCSLDDIAFLQLHRWMTLVSISVQIQ